MAPPRPHGYVPPRPASLADAARTLRALGVDGVPILARLALHGVRPAASTTSAAGLRATHAAFGRALRHLGIELSVLRAEALPREGGVVLMCPRG